MLGACSLTNLSDLTGGIPGGTGTALYSIGGTVSGLEGTSVKVARNADDVVTVAADGRFTFQQKLPTGALYVITVLRVPP